MDIQVAARRRKLAQLQHDRVMEEADFVAQLTRQARNRAGSAAAPVYGSATTAADEVRKRLDLHPAPTLIGT